MWTELEQYIRAAEIDKPWPSPIVAAMIDDELRELTYHIERDVEVTPLGMDDRDGSRIYRRSLTLLLVVAVQELFPEARLRVDHSVTFGGYYCEVEGRPPFSAAELARIEDHMRAIVAEDAPIGKQRVPLADAIEVFRRRGDEDMARLMRHRRKDFLVLYDLRGVSSYFHGYMVPSTGYLRYFSLTPYSDSAGFVLRFPHRSGLELEPAVDYPKLIQVFREYGHTLRLLGIEDVGALDDAIQAGRTGEIILVAEALHEQRIARIATQIAERKDQTAPGTDRRPVVVRQNDFLQAFGCPTAGRRRPARRHRVGQLLRGPGADAPGRTGQLQLRSAGGAGSPAFQPASAPAHGRRGGDAAEVQFRHRQARSRRHHPARPGPDPDRRGDPRAEPAAGAGRPDRAHLPHLRLGADAAQHRPL